MLKEIVEVLACVASFISGDYLDEEPNEWYRRCNLVIEDSSVCHKEMTEDDFNIQWQKQVEMREEQHEQEWQEIKNNLNKKDIESIIAYLEYYGKDMEAKMEDLARMLQADYRWESTIYGANKNKNEQYIDIKGTGVTISFTNHKNGDKSVSVHKENYEYVYSVTYEYEK